MRALLEREIDVLLASDGLGVIDVGFLIGLLDREATAEGTREGCVAAADGADVAGRGADAVEVVREGDGHVEVLGLGLGEAVDAWDIVLNSQRDLAGEAFAIGCHVKVAGVRASSVGVDLVYRDLDFAAFGDLGDAFGLQGVFGFFADVDVAFELGAAALVDDVGFDFGGAD